MLVFDRLRAFDFAGGKNDARRASRHSFSFMRLIYRHFFNRPDQLRQQGPANHVETPRYQA
jgi:hypothetical protein